MTNTQDIYTLSGRYGTWSCGPWNKELEGSLEDLHTGEHQNREYHLTLWRDGCVVRQVVRRKRSVKGSKRFDGRNYYRIKWRDAATLTSGYLDTPE